jgi:hypothetical protein
LFVKQKARPITKHTIRETITKLLVKSGTRQAREVHLTHGFRKFFTNQLFEADLKTEYRWSLEGHKLKGNDPYYVRISEKLLLEQYRKGINNLTINEEFRLKMKVKKFEIEKSELEMLTADVAELKKIMKNKDGKIR